ncbi:MAG: cytochrome B561 [Rhodospirillaceae bacterium BRH_c57]|nr:MAG: cytochrome B561 [Rhodospirillaceae bacterium BRH_c57]
MRDVRVWDPLVRLFHWSLVGAMATAFLAEDVANIHNTAGYIALGLVVFRLVWGVVGTRHARFTDFVTRPRTVVAYVGSLFKGHADRYMGHNPAGGLMILALLFGVAVTAGSGALMVTDRFWGVGWLEDIHEMAANVMLGLVAVHVLGVVVSSLLHRENLVRAMVTGRKRV